VIWAGVGDRAVEPRLAFQFVADNGLEGTADYQKRLFLTDALTGEILYQQNQIVHVEVVGSVSGHATQGVGADECGPEELAALPYARVRIDKRRRAFADRHGNFVMRNRGKNPVTVVSKMRGRYFKTLARSGPKDTLRLSVKPPGPAHFLHNESNNKERVRALVNCYVGANVARDFVLAQNPSYPTIADERGFHVNVNIQRNCNAFYDGRSINFFTSGGGCNNTGFSSVVYHEYGHHVVRTGGSDQGQYGEGMSDVMGVLIQDQPRFAVGFRRGNCESGPRSANNEIQYPCEGGIHYCGQLLSGCVWSTRNELKRTHPDDYLEILSNLAINAVLLHNGAEITPQITIDYLTLDDDDGEIGNGTPHYLEIAAGFGAHNMGVPPLPLLWFEYPSGRPWSMIPDEPKVFNVRITDLAGKMKPGTAALSYSIDGGPFQTDPLREINEPGFEGTLPGP